MNMTRHCEGVRLSWPGQGRATEAISLFRGVCFVVASLLLAMTICVAPAFAESSVNVPVHHWAYDELDVLSRARLTDSSGLSTKPITRMDAARLTQTAIERIQNEEMYFSEFDEMRSERAEDALNRLIDEFRPELLKLGVTSVAKDDMPAKKFNFQLADPIYTQTIYADLNKMNETTYENQRGMRLREGFTYRTRMLAWAEYDDFISVALEPSAIFAKDTEDFEIETGYVKLSYWNTEIEIGRDTMWWGPGFHGSMLMTDNAYPMNLFKIKSAHPFMLPWEKLGKWNMDFFLAELEKKRDYSNAKLSGLRLECTPIDRLTLGFSRTAIFGGDGRPHLDLGDYWNIFWGTGELNQDVSKNASNQLSSVDFKLNITDSLQLYGEWAGEDKFAPWENEAPGFLTGIYISDLLNIKNLDFRTEYARDDAAWYEHGIYTTGYKYKGNIIGHHMGGSAQDLFMRLSKNFSESQQYFESFTLGGQFDYEQHGRSMAYPEGKYEAAIDSTFYISGSKSARIMFKRQEYSNFENVSGAKTSNNIFEAEANIRF